MPEPTKPSILFVCLGNICRSPMAEAVFTHLITQRGLRDRFGTIDSAGTAAYHVGNAPDPRSVSTCNSHSIPVSHAAQQIQVSHWDSFTHILCMDRENLADLEQVRPRHAATTVTLKLFGEYDREKDLIIKDPYYGGPEGFEKNYRQVVRCSEGLLESLGMA